MSAHEPGRARPSDGFAVVAVVFVLAVVASLASGSYYVARQQLNATRRGVGSGRAFYAADGGLHAALARWDPRAAYRMAPGEAATLGTARLASRARYRLRATRLDLAIPGRPAYYLVESIGRGQGPRGGRRRVALLLRTQPPELPCCEAALLTPGTVHLEPGAAVSGRDDAAESRGPRDCGSSSPVPGILTGDQRGVISAPGVRIVGDPPVAANGLDLEAGLLEARLRYAELAKSAELTYRGGTTLRTIAPVKGSDGGCARKAPGNWGAPNDPRDPCWRYRPVIHALGDLRIEAGGAGQGTLLVDGSLKISEGFEFRGVVASRGGIRIEGGGGHIVGRVLILSADTLATWLGRAASISHSSCAVREAVGASQVHMPHPLAEKAWFQILE